MNVLQSLKSISAYPVPTLTLQEAASEGGVDTDTEVTAEVRQSAAFKRAQACVLRFLSEAPNVSQGGQSYSFNEYERKQFRRRAEQLLDEIGDDTDSLGIPFGYMGEDF